MFLKWYWQETQILLTWSVKSWHWYIITPRFLAEGLGWIFSSTTWINSREGLQRNFEVMRTSSVLSWLSLRQLFTIQQSMSFTQRDQRDQFETRSIRNKRGRMFRSSRFCGRTRELLSLATLSLLCKHSNKHSIVGAQKVGMPAWWKLEVYW